MIKCEDIGKIENIKVHLVEQVERGGMQKSYWIGKSIGKPNCSLCHTVWTARGTGTALTESVIGERKSKTVFII